MKAAWFAALLALLLVLLTTSVQGVIPNGSVPSFAFWNQTTSTGVRYGTGQPLPGEVVAVSVGYNDLGMDAVGWDGLYLEANRDAAMPAGTEFYAMGYAEGAVSQHRMWQSYNNIIKPTLPLTAGASNWTNQQLAYMANQSSTPFWEQVHLLMAQLRGLHDGYISTAPAAELLSFLDVYLLSFIHEIGEVTAATGNKSYFSGRSSEAAADRNSFREMSRDSHCSALIKVTATDLFMAHNTWSGYYTMLRQYKVYNFTHRTISFSGRPGKIHSGDDWYILSNGLTVQETTNNNDNPASYVDIVPTSVAEFIRVMVANHLAANGSAWVRNFCTENSGTYNNQFMIVNMNLFTPGQPLLNDTLWVVEQMPNMCESADVTDVLRTQGYWASYNIPYFPKIYIWSGQLQLEDEFGSFFSYTDSTRPLMFKRDQGAITDVEGMKKIMRYNNYQVDPLSLIPNCTGTPDGKCNPPFSASLAIAKRGDLNPKVGDYGPLQGYFALSKSGAIDAKIVAWSTVKAQQGWIISGPTYDQVPPFQWSTSPFPDLPHQGIPDLVQFPWLPTQAVWSATPPAPPAAPPSPSGFRVWVIACIVGAGLIVGTAAILSFRACHKPQHQDEYIPLGSDDGASRRVRY